MDLIIVKLKIGCMPSIWHGIARGLRNISLARSGGRGVSVLIVEKNMVLNDQAQHGDEFVSYFRNLH